MQRLERNPITLFELNMNIYTFLFFEKCKKISWIFRSCTRNTKFWQTLLCCLQKTEEISTLSAKFHFEYFSNALIFPNKSELWLPTAWRLCHRSVGGRPGRRRSSGGRVRTYVSRTDDFLVDYAPNFGNIHGDHGARGWGRRLVSVSFLTFFAGSFCLLLLYAHFFLVNMYYT